MKWDPISLWLKAKAYADRAHAIGGGDQEFPLFCALSLEFLARAALAFVHPTLIAKPDDDGIGLMHALGLPTKRQPQSVEMKTVYLRLANIYQDFAEHLKFCEQMAYWRNEELHTGELPFETLTESKWLPSFYAAASFLCTKLDKPFADYVGDQREAALELIAASAKTQLKAVKDSIAAHRRVFLEKEEPERLALIDSSKKYQVGEFSSVGGNQSLTRHSCPACGAMARVAGRLVHETQPEVDGSELQSTQTFLAMRSWCPACGLKLNSPSELHMAGFEPRWSEVGTFSAREYFQFEDEDPYMNI